MRNFRLAFPLALLQLALPLLVFGRAEEIVR